MTPPQWLIEYWKNNKSWIKRYQRESWSINAELCGIPYDKDSTLWTKTNIRKFNKFMNENSIKLKKELILYRGTENVSPLMTELCYQMKNCQYLSTTKSRSIAKEFMGKKGYLHILYCKKGTKIYDMKDDYDSPVKREKEVLILPNHQLTLLEFKNNIVKWEIK